MRITNTNKKFLLIMVFIGLIFSTLISTLIFASDNTKDNDSSDSDKTQMVSIPGLAKDKAVKIGKRFWLSKKIFSKMSSASASTSLLEENGDDLQEFVVTEIRDKEKIIGIKLLKSGEVSGTTKLISFDDFVKLMKISFLTRYNKTNLIPGISDDVFACRISPHVTTIEELANLSKAIHTRTSDEELKKRRIIEGDYPIFPNAINKFSMAQFLYKCKKDPESIRDFNNLTLTDLEHWDKNVKSYVPLELKNNFRDSHFDMTDLRGSNNPWREPSRRDDATKLLFCLKKYVPKINFKSIRIDNEQLTKLFKDDSLIFSSIERLDLEIVPKSGFVSSDLTFGVGSNLFPKIPLVMFLKRSLDDSIFENILKRFPNLKELDLSVNSLIDKAKIVKDFSKKNEIIKTIALIRNALVNNPNNNLKTVSFVFGVAYCSGCGYFVDSDYKLTDSLLDKLKDPSKTDEITHSIMRNAPFEKILKNGVLIDYRYTDAGAIRYSDGQEAHESSVFLF
ncbi:MAG: hypothetical protein HQK49_07865 [Oligoflexia bacterium]|nr:hypothetical protein [Oligoflexia bacterium]